MQQLAKSLPARALNGEMKHYLGYEKNNFAGNSSANSRNGTTPKTLKGKRDQVGTLPIQITWLIEKSLKTVPEQILTQAPVSNPQPPLAFA